MAFSEMLRRVDLVRTDVSEELSVSFIRVTRIGELGTTLAVASNRRTLLTRATRRNIPEDVILHSHRRENLKSYSAKRCFPQTGSTAETVSSSVRNMGSFLGSKAAGA
jgi:hypothetical protein